MIAQAHYSVLLKESIEGLIGNPDGIYVDGTFGRGGHCGLLLQQLGSAARVIAFDKDPAAIEVGTQMAVSDTRLTMVHASFSSLGQVASDMGIAGKIDGVLLDLGVSSPQIDEAERGFSFMHDGPLDMRMDPTQGRSAAQWLASVSENELIKVLRDYGEERFARRIAGAIIKYRKDKDIETTKQLADIVAEANPKWEPGKNPATRSFQAIRIYINNELGDLESVLPAALNAVKSQGRIVAISFHSLEDRIVKRFFKAGQRGEKLPANLPIRDAEIKRLLKIISKPIKAGVAELDENIRSRSAVLRIAEKL